MKKENGFSIMELLVTLIIVAILAIILTPYYKNYILKGNRSDAIRSLLATQVNQEEWRLTNTNYTGTIANISPTGTATSIGGFYTLSVSGATSSAYTLTATATGTQTGDTGCTTLTITYANGTSVNTPPSCWQ